MHDESMTDENQARAAAEAFELRVVRALETQPEPNIPADFAARVASRLPVSGKISVREMSYGVADFSRTDIRRTHYGRSMMMISMAVLVVAMLAFAPRAVLSSALWVGLEWTLCAQFVLLALWFVMRPERLR
jgi:hypothetical protein